MRRTVAFFSALRARRAAVPVGGALPRSPRALPPGPILAIGGAEDKFDERTILKRFVADAGGNGARIAIVPTASSIPEKRTEFYGEVFAALGAAESIPVPIATRAEAESEMAALLTRATGVFLTGGDQSRLTAILRGTRAHREIISRWRCGAALAGTSAAASAFSAVMIAGGESGLAVRLDAVELSAGLAMLPELLIDQHFSQRERLGRLLSAVARQPHLLGVGLDEDTAIATADGRELSVVGSGQVFLLDASRAAIPSSEGDSFSPAGIAIHVLKHGDVFDVSARAKLGSGDQREEAGSA